MLPRDFRTGPVESYLTNRCQTLRVSSLNSVMKNTSIRVPHGMMKGFIFLSLLITQRYLATGNTKMNLWRCHVKHFQEQTVEWIQNTMFGIFFYCDTSAAIMTLSHTYTHKHRRTKAFLVLPVNIRLVQESNFLTRQVGT